MSYGDNSLQKAALRLPKKSIIDPLPAPVIVIIHGGCWTSSLADYHIMDPLSDAITELGYATWNIEYRGIGMGGEWPNIFLDVGKAVDYLRIVAQAYPIDITHTITLGHSAGGHLALWLASRHKIDSASPIYVPDPLPIHGALSLAGIADLTASTACNNSADAIINTKATAPSTNVLKDTSPIAMLPTGVRTVIISGASDSIVRASVGDAYTMAASRVGDASVHYILSGLGHFELINPQQTDWSLYQSSLKELMRD